MYNNTYYISFGNGMSFQQNAKNVDVLEEKYLIHVKKKIIKKDL